MNPPIRLMMALLLVASMHFAPQAPGRSNGPRRYTTVSTGVSSDAALAALISEVRSQADAFVFLCGGASKMGKDQQDQLLRMFDALSLLARDGRRIAVGDGGTQAGIMAAAGLARRLSGSTFPLIGVAPAGEIPPRGSTPIDPNHSHIVAVQNPSAPAENAWGSETETMYWLFAKLAEGRPSVTIVANGGGITLSEVAENVRAGRHMILLAGSGRAADGLVSLLKGQPAADPDSVDLAARAKKEGLTDRADLYQVLPLSAGPTGLRDALAAALHLTPASPRQTPPAESSSQRISE
jgi:hypothetical protein